MSRPLGPETTHQSLDPRDEQVDKLSFVSDRANQIFAINLVRGLKGLDRVDRAALEALQEELRRGSDCY